LKHSVGVAGTLLKLRECLAPAISEESCVIVGFFHDVGKLRMPGKPFYIPNDNEWMVQKRGIKFKINPEVASMGLAARSLYLVTKHMPLTDAEAQAIAYHDGNTSMPTKSSLTKKNPRHYWSIGQITGPLTFMRKEERSKDSHRWEKPNENAA
jgi:hypothetical protein